MFRPGMAGLSILGNKSRFTEIKRLLQPVTNRSAFAKRFRYSIKILPVPYHLLKKPADTFCSVYKMYL